MGAGGVPVHPYLSGSGRFAAAEAYNYGKEPSHPSYGEFSYDHRRELQLREENFRLEAELKALRQENGMLGEENNRLRRCAQLVMPELLIPQGYEFGTRVFQCIQASPGVGYREVPDFTKKIKDGKGPHAPMVVVADAICQGPKAIFIRCTSGHGWLPLVGPSGERFMFKHLGRMEDVDMSKYQLNDFEVKTGQADSVAKGYDPTTGESLRGSVSTP
jgi:hypothetical protein